MKHYIKQDYGQIKEYRKEPKTKEILIVAFITVLILWIGLIIIL